MAIEEINFEYNFKSSVTSVLSEGRQHLESIYGTVKVAEDWSLFVSTFWCIMACRVQSLVKSSYFGLSIGFRVFRGRRRIVFSVKKPRYLIILQEKVKCWFFLQTIITISLILQVKRTKMDSLLKWFVRSAQVPAQLKIKDACIIKTHVLRVKYCCNKGDN